MNRYLHPFNFHTQNLAVNIGPPEDVPSNANYLLLTHWQHLPGLEGPKSYKESKADADYSHRLLGEGRQLRMKAVVAGVRTVSLRLRHRGG